MPCSTKFSKDQKMSVVTTPQRKSTLNVVNSTPVNNLIANHKTREPVQSPIEKTSTNTIKLTKSLKNSISGRDLSCVESSSFNSTPKSKAKCLFKSIGTEKPLTNDSCKMMTSNGDLASKSSGDKPISGLVKNKPVPRSKSNLSPTTKRQHYQMNQLSCSFNNPIGLTDAALSSENNWSNRLTRSFTKLNSDSETSIDVNQVGNASVEIVNKKTKTTKKDQPFSKSKKLSKNGFDNDSLTNDNVTKRLVDSESNDKVVRETKQTLPKASSKVNAKTVSAKDNSLNCSKNDVSEQNENALSSESCDSLGKRNSDNFSSQSISKPSFIRRKLYSQLSDFTDNESVKAVDASFLEKNNVKNVYKTKIKAINSQKVQSAHDNGGSNQSTNVETKRKSVNSLRNYCLRKNQRDSAGAEENSKENTCQFIVGLLKDIDPKIVPHVVKKSVNSNDTSASNDTMREIDENFDLFTEDAKDSGKAVVKKRKYVRKSAPKTKEPKREKPKPKINKTVGKKINDKKPRCISHSDSDTSVVKISIDRIDSDRKKKASEKASKVPVRHSKLAATKKIQKYAREVNLEKAQRLSGCDFSSEEDSDESPFRMYGKKKYSETYSTEEYDSPARVLKSLKDPSRPKMLSNRATKTVSTDLSKNYSINQRLPVRNRQLSPDSHFSIKSSNQSPLKSRAFNKLSYVSATCRNTEESKMVVRNSFIVGDYIVTAKNDSKLRREDIISNRMKKSSENIESDKMFGFKKSIFNVDRNQSTSRGYSNEKFNNVQSLQRWDRNCKKSTSQNDKISFLTNKSTLIVDNFKPPQNIITWNKAVSHSTKYEEFELPVGFHRSKSSKGDRLGNLKDNRSERRTHMEQYKYSNVQDDWRSRNLDPVRFENGKLVTFGKFSETSTSMISKRRIGTLSELKQKKEFQNVTLNFNRNHKQSVSNLFGSAYTDSFSQMNKGYSSNNSSMIFKRDDISLFKKSSAGMARDIRRLVHSQTVYPTAPESLFGKGSAASSSTSRHKSYAEANFNNSYYSKLKKYNHQDCLKMNVFGSEDARKNHAENSLFLSNYHSVNKFGLNRNEDRNESSATLQNRSKCINYKSSSGIGFPGASNRTYRASAALQSETFRPNNEVSEQIDDVRSVNNIFKMPQKPNRKRPITDLGEESDRGCFKIPKYNESLSSFGSSNTTHAALKGKENSYRDASYVISGTSRLKSCVFEQKSSLSGPISNSTFLGTASKISKSSGGVLPSDDIAIKKYNHKSIYTKQPFSQNDDAHVFDRMQFHADTSKKNAVDSSSIGGDIVMENLNLFQNSHISDRCSNTNAAKNESVLNKHNSHQLMPLKSDASFIVRKNNISSSQYGFTSVPSVCNLKPGLTTQSGESAHPSTSLQTKLHTPEKCPTSTLAVEESSAVSRSVNHSPWRFFVHK